MPERPEWRRVAAPPPLAAGEIHCWRFDLGRCRAGREAALTAWLSAAERKRAARYSAPVAGARFRSGRGLLRWVLAGYLDRTPAQLAFRYLGQGKPALAGAELQFNLSHSGDLALLAVARDRPLGIDLERLDSGKQLLAIARRVFPTERCRELEALEGDLRIQGFYRDWTAMEARVKARGDGVFRQLRNGSEADWPVRHWCPVDGYLAALAAPQLPERADAWVWLEPQLPY
jgi:4'-phosphopantetheinyl transferase